MDRVNVPIKEIERRMNTGGWYSKPMLLQQKSLVNTITIDKNKLKFLNLTADSLGEKLLLLIEQANKTDWFKPIVVQNFTVEIRRRRGFLTCPWSRDEMEECYIEKWRPTANEFKISNTSNGMTLTGFILSIHLIKAHCFFGGKDTDYRIEPSILAKILNEL